MINDRELVSGGEMGLDDSGGETVPDSGRAVSSSCGL
jgi:hypothetical protein